MIGKNGKPKKITMKFKNGIEKVMINGKLVVMGVAGLLPSKVKSESVKE